MPPRKQEGKKRCHSEPVRTLAWESVLLIVFIFDKNTVSGNADCHGRKRPRNDVVFLHFPFLTEAGFFGIFTNSFSHSGMGTAIARENKSYFFQDKMPSVKNNTE